MAPSDPASAPAPRPRIRVVVVDDSPALVRSLSEYLRTLPNAELAGTAATGAEAVDLCARLKPDLVLLDFAMPGINGLDAAKALRRHSAGTRIVMISNYSPFLAESGPWPDIDAVVDKLDLGHELPALIDQLFPPR